MTKINWKVRFSKNNIFFWIRVAVAVLTPALAVAGMDADDLTSWASVWNILVQIVSNPYLLALTVVAFLNVLPDPTTTGLSDSEQALSYTEPNAEKKKIKDNYYRQL